MSNLLREYIKTILLESNVSSQFEKSVANAINSSKVRGLSAVQSGGDTRFADVKVDFRDTLAYVEAKMGHGDPAGGNPRFLVFEDEFMSDYDTPTARLGEELLNSSPEAKSWINLVKFHLGYDKSDLLDIESQESDSSIIDAVRKAAKDLGNQYIMKSDDMSLTSVVTGHYTQGKDFPTNYIQMGNDFYLIGSSDPLGLKAANIALGNPPIPVLTGRGQFKVRASFRTKFMEIFPEIKISESPESMYSVFGDGNKINPFKALNQNSI
jgi:hypothetical protein